VQILSLDPAHSLGDALEMELGNQPAPHPDLPTLRAAEVDFAAERSTFLAREGRALASLLERGTYLSDAEVERFLELELPGLAEIAGYLRLLALSDAGGTDRLICDTAPTGHTLRLLDLSRSVQGWLEAMEAMEEKHRAVAIGLTRSYTPGASAELVIRLREGVVRMAARLQDPDAVAFVLVETPEEVVREETDRYAERLELAGVRLAGRVVNRGGAGSAPGAAARVPPLAGEPTGLQGLRAFAAAAVRDPEESDDRGAANCQEELRDGSARAPAPDPSAQDPTSSPAGSPFALPLDRTLHLVAGKGGVGKSTTAACIALRAAEAGRRTLLLSVDPAGSLGDLLEMEVGGEPRAVPGAPRLEVAQLEAEGAWERFVAGYRAQIESLLGELLGGGGGADLDRRVMVGLLDTAPPGIDELMGVLESVDRLEGGGYDALVLDTAPTGHLLRLLDTPRLALEWVHELLRMLLRYRDALGLGGAAEGLLEIARDLRGFGELLRDPSRTALYVVALPEALSLPETERLMARLAEMGIEIEALLVNRAPAPGEDGPRAARLRQLRGLGAGRVATLPLLPGEPRGADALRAFAGAWRTLNGG
jgi:arsenite/tail-anchored protein-transporting ATPase